MSEPIPLGDDLLVDRDAEVGSPMLAAALDAQDIAAIGIALRIELVVVPQLVTAEGERQTRVFSFAGGKPRLLLFSSAATYAAFLGDDPERAFALQPGIAVVGILAGYGDLLEDVVFDAAGPRALSVSPSDFAAALNVVPAATLGRLAEYPADADPAAARAVGLDIALTSGWFTINLGDAEQRDAQVRELIQKQFAGVDVQPALRERLVRKVRDTCIRAASVGGVAMAFLLQHNEAAALALSVTQFWHPLGRNGSAGEHLESRIAAIMSRDPRADLTRNETNAGPYARHVHTEVGPSDLGASEISLLVIDYWLEFPDRRGIVQVSFSSPHGDLRHHLLRLADSIVLHGTWVLDVAT